MTAERTPRPNRRRFLAAAALPIAAAGTPALAAGRTPEDPLVELARQFGRLVPAWTEAARGWASNPDCAESRRRFEAIDSRHDQAKRNLLRRMRAEGKTVVMDRAGGRLYLDLNPAGCHEDLDGDWTGREVVRVLPLDAAAGLA